MVRDGCTEDRQASGFAWFLFFGWCRCGAAGLNECQADYCDQEHTRCSALSLFWRHIMSVLLLATRPCTLPVLHGLLLSERCVCTNVTSSTDCLYQNGACVPMWHLRLSLPERCMCTNVTSSTDCLYQNGACVPMWHLRLAISSDNRNNSECRLVSRIHTRMFIATNRLTMWHFCVCTDRTVQCAVSVYNRSNSECRPQTSLYISLELF